MTFMFIYDVNLDKLVGFNLNTNFLTIIKVVSMPLKKNDFFDDLSENNVF